MTNSIMVTKVNDLFTKVNDLFTKVNDLFTKVNDLFTEVNGLKTESAEIKALIKDFKRNLKGLVEIQQRLVHERLGVPVPISPKEYGEESNAKTTAKIDISNLGDDRIKISGKTFDYKDAIKEAGSAKFDQGSKSWSLPLESLNQLIKNFEEINLVQGTDFTVNVKGVENSNNDEEEEEGFGSGF